MSIVQPGGSGDIPEIPDGLYTATIKHAKDVTLEQADSFGNTEKVEIQVAFTDSDGVSQTLEPRVNRKWGEKATLFTIAMAAGCDAEPFEPFDTDLLVGKKVNILVETPEEGKWPRVKAWSRVRGHKASAPPQTPPGPSNTPAMITAVGLVDWQVFWRVLDEAGYTREMVAKELDGDLNNLERMEPTQVVDFVDTLKGRVPFA